MPDSAKLRRILVGTRLTIGLIAFLFPRTMGTMFGISSARNPSAPFVARLFGAREALMAYQLYQASDDELEEILRQGILVDGTDIAGALISLLRGEISMKTFALAGTTAGAVITTAMLSRESALKP